MANRQNMNYRKVLSTTSICVISPLVIAFLAFTPSSVKAGDASQTEHIAKMAMSTASMWMIERHEHKIEKGIKEGNIAEALEEADELIPWIEGTPWLDELVPHSKEAVKAVKQLVNKLESKDREGAKTALKEMKMKFHHFHHELMEIVAEGKKKGGHGHITH